ncbi:hypothetical protein V8C86DRAFT_2574794 [Haematococcus lacustris]
MAPALMLLFLLVCRPIGLRADQAHEVGEMEHNPELIAQRAELQRLVDELRMAMPAADGAGGRDLLRASGTGLGGLGGLAGLGNLAASLGGSVRGGMPNLMAGMPNLMAGMPNLLGGSARQSLSSLPGIPGLVGAFSPLGTGGMSVLDGIAPGTLVADVLSGDFITTIFDPSNGAVLDPGLAAIVDGTDTSADAVAILALLSAIFNLVSSILYIVSGGLGTAAGSLALVPASLGLVTGEWEEGNTTKLTHCRVLQTVDTVVQRFTGVLTQLADRLGGLSSGSTAASVNGFRSQLQQASGLLQSTISKYNPAAAA